MYKTLDLNLLKVFEAVMIERSTSLAANRLGRTQSAVSHALSRLRLALNDELFVRSMGEMLPTPVAMELASEVLPALQAISEKIESSDVFDPLRSRREFTVAITDYTAMGFCADLLKAFRQHAPQSRLRFIHASEAQAEERLLRRDADIAVLGNTQIANADLVVEPQEPDQNLCICWSGSRFANATISLTDYVGAAHVQVSINGHSFGVADKLLEAMNHSRHIVSVVPHYTMVPAIIKGTDLLAIVGSRILLNLSDRDEIALASTPLDLPPVSISTVYRSNSVGDAAHRWLRQMVNASLGKQVEMIRSDDAMLQRQ